MNLRDLHPDTWVVVITAVGTTVVTTATILLALQRWFMPRMECARIHKDNDAKTDARFEEDKSKRHEIRGILNKVVFRQRKMERKFDIYSERQRWLMAGVESLMNKVGANGVPPPPTIAEPDWEDEGEEDEE